MLSKDCDLLVIGTGAGAMSAALRASTDGLKVLMVEKEETFGGQSARSGGGLWIPNNPHAARAGVTDSREQAVTYFRHETGNRYDEDRVGAFLDNGPKMLEFVEANTTLRFQVLSEFPDYHSESPGGAQGGRSLFPLPWNGAELGDDIKRLRPVLRQARFLDMQIGVSDVPYFLTAARKLRSFLYVAGCMLARARDQLRGGRTLRLVSGNALVAGLAAAAFRNGVELLTATPARELLREEDRVVGAIVDTPQGPMRIRARCGVILATGGFPHDSKRRAELFPTGATAPEVWGMFPYGNSGDGIRMGEAAGGAFDSDMTTAIALTPITRLHVGEGTLETNPIFFNRGAPGVISVTRRGTRFVNEARSYHDWGVALLEECRGEPEAVAWIVSDARALARYGLGIVKPWPFSYKRHVQSGYLKTGRTVGELARQAGIDPAGLEKTIQAFNRDARNGEDPAFHRGSSAYQLANGDADHKGRNPCVGPLDKPPFFAIRVFAGCVGTFAGLRTNGDAQALATNGEPIAGLYVVGNDMASITGGDYISGGCTLGPAMTFGYIAAGHIAAESARGARAERKVA